MVNKLYAATGNCRLSAAQRPSGHNHHSHLKQLNTVHKQILMPVKQYWEALFIKLSPPALSRWWDTINLIRPHNFAKKYVVLQ